MRGPSNAHEIEDAVSDRPPFSAQVFLDSKKLGFIEYDGERPLEIDDSIQSVVLHD